MACAASLLTVLAARLAGGSPSAHALQPAAGARCAAPLAARPRWVRVNTLDSRTLLEPRPFAFSRLPDLLRLRLDAAVHAPGWVVDVAGAAGQGATAPASPTVLAAR